MEPAVVTPAPIPDDTSHFIHPDASQRQVGPGRPRGTLTTQPTASLNYKVKALSQTLHRLNGLRIKGRVEGDALISLMQALIDEADSDGVDAVIRQKYYQVVLDAYLRVHELHAKTAADCLDLETKRSDTRLKRSMWRDKQGIGKTMNASSEPAGLAEVAALMRDR